MVLNGGDLLEEGNVKVTVKFFASAADAVGERERQVDLLDGADISALMDALCEECSRLGMMRPNIRVAINHEYAAESEPLSDGDEVALIPPVSGGR